MEKIIERFDKETGKVDFTTMENCIEHTEGRGYWKPGTVEKMLLAGNGVFTPFYIYNIKKPEQTIKLSECNNLMKIIAEAKIKQDGIYYCMFNGKKTAVTE